MLPAQNAFIEQVRRDVGNHEFHLAQIAGGQFRPHRDGVDITDEFVADARSRRDLGISIIRFYGG